MSSSETTVKNKYELLFVGLACVITFIGGKFLCEDVSERAELYLRHPLFIYMTLFAATWLATRDTKMALLLTLGFAISRECYDRFCCSQ